MSGTDSKILLTGIRASGDVHLGNYLGAMQPAIAAQKSYQSYFFIADLHGLTTTPPAEELRKTVRSVAAAWLACGLDPESTVLWKQSEVPEVLELAYVLACLTGLGLLERGHSVKDARAKGKPVRAGLFYYPVLMAADILLYDTDLVPVGQDQVQHLEMTRDMATYFNETYGPLFKLPQAIVREEVAVVPGIDGQKMSKSYNNGIEIFAPEDELKRQVMRIVTDSKTLQEPKNPDECLVYQIFRLVASKEESLEMANRLRAGNYGYGDAKKQLLSCLLDRFGPMRQKYQHLQDHPDELNEILKQGAEKARQKASKMIVQVRNRVGL